MKSLTFPSTPILAMVDFRLATALGNLLIAKGIITPDEMLVLYTDVANSLSDTPEMDEAKTVLRQLAAP